MDEQVAHRQIDSCLSPFLQATDEAESQRLLSRLITEHVEPIIRHILKRKLRVHLWSGIATRRSQDAEDISGEVLVQLLKRLRDFKTNPEDKAISNFRGHVAVTTYHAYHAYLRQKYPARWRLKNKLRYLLTHTKEFALWEGGEREWLCGFAVWRDRQIAVARGGLVQQWRDSVQAAERAELSSAVVRRMRLAELLILIFKEVGAPVELDELVNTVADLWDAKDHTLQIEAEHKEGAKFYEDLPDPQTSVATEVEQRHYLQYLWAEICQLPARQRAVLLLNLREARGGGCIALFPLTGIATMRQIAEAVALPAGQFAALWNDLPLDDATIATHLGVTRQQVINLRKSARQRLARRMRSFDERKVNPRVVT